MGNSVSSELGHRQPDAPCVEGFAAAQHARPSGMPRQITVCLDASTPVAGLQSKVPSVASANGQQRAHASGASDPDLLLREGEQKVLLWNCNPTDVNQKDQSYATVDSSVKAVNGPTPGAANKLTRSRGRKTAAEENFDMHPAVSSDVAGSLPRSSSSSSDSSFRGRNSSIDETMPHGPDQSSDEEHDVRLALASHKVPKFQSHVQGDVRQPDHQAGWLIIHPRSSTSPEQVMWVLERQQLLATPAISSSGCVMSPTFILPCATGAARQSVTSEWCLSVTRLPSSTRDSCRFQLGLSLCSAVAVTSSSNPDCQAPGSPMHGAAAVDGAVEVYCMGRVSVRLGSGPHGSEPVKFESVLQPGGQLLDLPIALRLAHNQLDIVAKSQTQQQQQQFVTSAAAAPSNSEDLQIVLDFSASELMQPKAGAAGSHPATQQQQHDISRSDQGRDQGSSIPKGVSTVASSVSGGAAAPARQLEAVLLSTSPRMLVVDGFFDAKMCEDLMCLAEGKLVRSRVASGSETPSRTSWSHFFVKEAAKQALIMSAESQIEALFKSEAVRGPFPPLTKVEALQVVKYHKGEFYHEHYDNRADSPLTRAATIIVYLCDTEEGGGTSFPRAVTGWTEGSDWQLPPKVTFGPGGQGIKVLPVQGRALVFWSKRADGSEDPNSIHAADTVIKGHKWIATRWMKDD